jgi:predicted flap endonuclease-1-like 5' DNA nuclease
VLIDEDNKFMEVVVPDTQLSLAIGKRGQNVRLAAQLTGWKIDVMGETGMSQRYDDAKFSLTQVPGITDTLATLLFQNGYKTIFEIAEAKTAEILGLPGFDNEETVAKIIEAAKTVVESGNVLVKTPDEKFTVVEKKTADELLREEMQMLLKKEQSANAEAVSDLLDIKGVGPSMVKAMNEAGVMNIEGLASMEETTFVDSVNWENKEELKAVYKEALINHKETLIKEGKLEGFNEEEKQRLLELSGLSNSVLLRLAASGLNSIELIKASSLEDFVSLNAVPNEKAEEVYNAVKAL